MAWDWGWLSPGELRWRNFLLLDLLLSFGLELRNFLWRRFAFHLLLHDVISSVALLVIFPIEGTHHAVVYESTFHFDTGDALRHTETIRIVEYRAVITRTSSTTA